MEKVQKITASEPKGIRKYGGTHVNIASFVNRFILSRKTGHAKNRVT